MPGGSVYSVKHNVLCAFATRYHAVVAAQVKPNLCETIVNRLNAKPFGEMQRYRSLVEAKVARSRQKRTTRDLAHASQRVDG